jgi:serine/threonine-protein kinase
MPMNDELTAAEEVQVVGSALVEHRSGPHSNTLDEDERAIGPYRVYGRIASGGMASVYLACREGSGTFKQVVAVKRMHSHLAKRQEYVDMFLDEVRLASRIRHPYITSIIDFGRANGRPYMAMEYVAGESLSAVVSRLAAQPEVLASPRFPRIVTRIIANLAEGLHAAHEATDDQGNLLGLVHRDVNPPNLFLVGDGSVRVIDFGVACADRRLHHTPTGILKGKIGYMAPEGFRRETVDRRADVWALGVVMWELLTAKRLFRRPSEMETIAAVCSNPVPRPSTVNPVVPRALEHTLAMALRPDRTERFQTAHDFARELENHMDTWNDPIPAGELGRWLNELVPNARDRHRKLIAAVRHQYHLDETNASSLIPLVSVAGPAPARRRATLKRWPFDHWRTLAVAASLAVLVTAGLAWTSIRRPDHPRPAVVSGAAASEVPPHSAAPRIWTATELGQAPAPVPAAAGERGPAPLGERAPRRPTHRPSRTTPPDPAPALVAEISMAPVAEIGQVFITTPGITAEVTFEGQVIAWTPCYVTLPAGRQRLTIGYPGQATPTPIEVTVSPRTLVKVRAMLKR